MKFLMSIILVFGLVSAAFAQPSGKPVDGPRMGPPWAKGQGQCPWAKEMAKPWAGKPQMGPPWAKDGRPQMGTPWAKGPMGPIGIGFGKEISVKDGPCCPRCGFCLKDQPGKDKERPNKGKHKHHKHHKHHKSHGAA